MTNSDDFTKHVSSLKKIAARMLNDSSEADDVVQEVWLASLKHPASDFDDHSAWLRAVTRTVARDVKRSGARRAARERRAAKGEQIEHDLTITMDQETIRGHLSEALTSLEEPYAGALRQHYFNGRTAREIAEDGSHPVSTVESWLRRGLERLRERLTPQLGGDRAFGIALISAFDWEAKDLARAGVTTGSVGATLWSLRKAAAVLALIFGGVAAVLWVQRTGTSDLPAPELAGAKLVQPSTPTDAGLQDLDSSVAMDERSVVPEEGDEGAMTAASTTLADSGAEGGGSPESSLEGDVLHSFPITVLDDAGLPQPNATVWKRVGPREARKLELAGSTDADGKLEFDVLSTDTPLTFGLEDRMPRRLEMIAKKPGQANSLGVLVDFEDTTREALTLRLRGPELVVRGLISDGGGRPVAGAQLFEGDVARMRTDLDLVTIVRTKDDEMAIFNIPVLTTGADGAFAFHGRPRVQIKVQVRAEGFADCLLEASVDEIERGPLEAELEPQCVIQGVVFGPDGEPAPDAELRLQFLTGSSLAPIDLVTDAQGRFRIAQLPRCDVRLRAFKDRASTRFDVAVKQDNEPVEVHMESGWALELQLVDKAGLPCKGHRALVEGTKETSYKKTALFTDEFGFVRLPGCPRSVRVVVWDEKIVAPIYAETFDEVPSEAIVRTIARNHDALVTISAEVAIAQRMLPPGGSVAAWWMEGRYPMPARLDGGQRGIKIENCPRGKYDIFVYFPGQGGRRLETIEVIDHDLDLGTLDLGPPCRLEFAQAWSETSDLSIRITSLNLFSDGKTQQLPLHLGPPKPGEVIEAFGEAFYVTVRDASGEMLRHGTYEVDPGTHVVVTPELEGADLVD